MAVWLGHRTDRASGHHVNRAEAFYGERLGLRKLYCYGDLTFFDCAGIRLLLEKVGTGFKVTAGRNPFSKSRLRYAICPAVA
jgi:hypothetical protein